uniref:Uncharacterized protein n=1 Tax=Sphaeramia orbicularis TaxID=375764 RepID=A0A673B8T1_9TELE
MLLFCCPACLPVDYKGGNGYIISPCSSVNSRSVLASNAIGNQCKSKKPLSAAKVCIPQILPSKFKPKLLTPSGDSQNSRTKASRHPKAHSCEDLYIGSCDADGQDRHLDAGADSGDGLGNAPPAVRRSASEFSSLYKTMHHIHVRSLASLFEKSKVDGGERSEADEGGNIPRDAVSARVTEFEMIIQRCNSSPSATEAEVEQILSKTSSDQTQISASKSPSSFLTPSPHPHHPHHHHHLLHHLNHQLLKPSKCKGSCPASYTRFTTILRHERQQATAQQDRPPPPPSEKKTTLPVTSSSWARPFQVTEKPAVPAGAQRPCSLSPELRPLIPQRLSSLEVLERLSNGDGANTDHLSNGQSLDANGNLLQPLAAHRRGGYPHPFTSVTLLLSPKHVPISVVTHLSRLFISTTCPSSTK